MRKKKWNWRARKTVIGPVAVALATLPFLLAVLALVALEIFSNVFGYPSTESLAYVTTGQAIVTIIVVVCAAYMATWLVYLASSLRRVEFGPEVCGRCGYDLTGNESGVCSECGAGPEIQFPPDALFLNDSRKHSLMLFGVSLWTATWLSASLETVFRSSMQPAAWFQIAMIILQAVSSLVICLAFRSMAKTAWERCLSQIGLIFVSFFAIYMALSFSFLHWVASVYVKLSMEELMVAVFVASSWFGCTQLMIARILHRVGARQMSWVALFVLVGVGALVLNTFELLPRILPKWRDSIMRVAPVGTALTIHISGVAAVYWLWKVTRQRVKYDRTGEWPRY